MTGADMTARRQRLARRLTLAVTLIVALVGGAHLLAMRAGFISHMAPEMRLNLITAGQSLAGEINDALRHGVPLDKLHGMDDFLTGELRDTPDLAYVAVVSAGGAVLYAAGPRLEEARSGLSGGAVEAERLARRNGFLELALPLRDGARPVGAVVVAVTGDRAFPLALAGLFAGLVLAGAVLAGWITAWVQRRRMAEPLARLEEVLDQAVAGHFALSTGVPASVAAGRLAGKVDAMLADLRDRHARAGEELEELRQGQIDKAVLAEMTELAARLDAIGVAREASAPQDTGSGRCC